MLSLNSITTQNQIFVSFSQFSLRYPNLFHQRKHNSTKNKNVKLKESTGAIYDAIICQDSFDEALRNCDKNVNEMRSTNLKSVYPFVKTSKCYNQASECPSTQKVSYISSSSFDLNKKGWSNHTTEHISTIIFGSRGKKDKYVNLNQFNGLFKNIQDNSYNFNIQVRGFKTERRINADFKKNPSLITRLRTVLGLSITNHTTKPSNWGSEVTPKVEKLLNEDLTNQQKAKIKIAFAEGYVAGSHGEAKTSNIFKMIKTLSLMSMSLFVMIALIITLVSSFGGGTFRIQLGSKSEVDPEDINVTFDDVKGADEAKQELKEVVEFLKSPEKFSALGGKLPKGVLLVGPPGTGKTLLARAVAGEAGVPFFHAAGSEFDEILVGQGARRVRDLFKSAKERAPCVIFIDEIDSVGAKRTNSVLHPYANQTINQLLSEMDGFHQNEGVIILGATNRKEDLDQALLRPGRFDVEVPVPTPDYSGRLEILQMYVTRVKSHPELDLEALARGTTGFTGADIESMVNQAALKAAIDSADAVTMAHLEEARDKVLMGPARKSRIPDDEVNAVTAYHEGGHAVVAYYTKDSHPLHKVTIIPRGPSLGHTAYIPAKEIYHYTKQQLLANMDTMMGGRAAEELVYGLDKITSGASSDLKQATSIACRMVREWGMSEKVGLRTLEQPQSSLAATEQLGPGTNELVDAEIKKILSDSYERAKAILRAHAKEHKALAEALLKYETLDAEDIKAVMNGEKVKSERGRKEVPSPSPAPAPAPPSAPAGLLGPQRAPA